MKHPLLALAAKERLHDDALRRSLNPAKVNSVTAKDKPRKLADGGGLYLLVLPKGREGKPRRLWRYKYRIAGREGLYAIGALPEIGLADARQIHRAARWLVESGIPPAHHVREERARHEAERSRRANTFAVVCEQWLERDAAKLAPGSMTQRKRELKNDVLPVLGAKPIDAIRKPELTELLQKLETRAPEVARNVRHYLIGVFEYAEGAGLVTGSPVPSSKVLKPRSQKPYAALPAEKAGVFLHSVDAADCLPQTRIAVRLLTLTAVRKVELLAARWSEFELDKGEWQIPASRMKMRETHWVPLSPQAVKLLRELRQHSHGELLFPNLRNSKKPMSGNSINALFGRLGYLKETKPHGIRAMFSTYANSMGWNPDVVEKILAHQHKDLIRAKYNRAEYRKEQRAILQRWADQLDRWYHGKSGKVVPMKSRARVPGAA